jgi:hypothetical protein
VTFEATGNGIADDNFAAKLIGKTTKGKLLFGYSRLPGGGLFTVCCPPVGNKASQPSVNGGESAQSDKPPVILLVRPSRAGVGRFPF